MKWEDKLKVLAALEYIISDGYRYILVNRKKLISSLGDENVKKAHDILLVYFKFIDELCAETS